MKENKRTPPKESTAADTVGVSTEGVSLSQMGKAPAFQLYSSDFLTGTMLMSNAEVGLYIRLLCLQAEHGSVPDDVERIVQAFGEPSRILWPVVRSKFVAGGIPGSLVNARLNEVLAAREGYRMKQSAKGKRSAELRFNRGSTAVEPLEDEDRGIDIGRRNTKDKKDAREDFISKCKAVVAAQPDRLPVDLRAEFLSYWTEQDAKGRMRFQAQKFFDHGRRMDTWRRNAEARPSKFVKPDPSPTMKPWIG